MVVALKEYDRATSGARNNHMATQQLTEDFARHDLPTPHLIEREVRRSLLARPNLRFTSLVVRRIDNGVCLEGVVETDGERCDVDRLATQVAGVDDVLNRLVVRRPHCKG